MKRVLLSTCLLAFGASPAFAAKAPEEGFYAGLAYGVSKIDDKAFRDQTVMSVDDKDSSLQLWGGYRFSKWVAMEARFATLGEYTAVIDDGNSGTTGADIKSSALTVNMKAIVPFGESGFDAYGVLGVGLANWDADIGAVDPAPALSGSDNEIAVTYGVGIRWTIIPALTVQLGVDGYSFETSTAVSYEDPNDANNTIVQPIKFDSNTLSATLGVQYNF